MSTSTSQTYRWAPCEAIENLPFLRRFRTLAANDPHLSLNSADEWVTVGVIVLYRQWDKMPKSALDWSESISVSDSSMGILKAFCELLAILVTHILGLTMLNGGSQRQLFRPLFLLAIVKLPKVAQHQFQEHCIATIVTFL
ncbi:hypothetical protein PAXRUDRAFT_826568 [Paxillus rubicundulus Ve08.2h10]|uniref:Uncharacterized protein n=1 Tax=Paxillus rubicundulus Ve08.2h10 TaxID=930991 RepID=A0A0D0E450_9AGAM|nr:hypothetical protein PAXRUDRAFT_826568 [Paxillus rubicundulus Ve08.2h10]